jgi:arsenate reductase
MLTLYAYKNCDTCRRALRWLAEHEIPHRVRAIRETPPARAELEQALAFTGNLKSLFNTAGTDYRQLGLKDKLAAMTVSEAITLLTENGNLVKRPFASGDGIALAGFDPETWRAALTDRTARSGKAS